MNNSKQRTISEISAVHTIMTFEPFLVVCCSSEFPDIPFDLLIMAMVQTFSALYSLTLGE